jgi:O-antigen ligase
MVSRWGAGFVLRGLIATLLILPWIVAGVLGSTQSYACWTVAALLVCAVGTLLHTAGDENVQSTGLGRPTVYSTCLLWLLFAGIALGCCQLVPIPASLAPWLASGATTWRQQQLGDQGLHQDGLLETSSPESLVASCRSIYPPATRKNLAQLILATAVFWLAVGFVSDSNVHWLLIGAAANGVAIALVGIVSRLSGIVSLPSFMVASGERPFGPFVNRNNAGGYMCLCLAAAIGLFLWIRNSRSSAGESGKIFDDRQFAAKFAAMGAVVFIAAGILATGSRGASLALVSAALLTLVVWQVAARSDGTQRRSVHTFSRLAMVSVAVAGTWSLLHWLGAAAETRQRWLRTLDSELADGRSSNWWESLQTSGEFLWFGSGLMTYRFTGLPNVERASERWYRFAENQFIQALVDAGVVGCGLMVAAILVVGWATWHLFKRPQSQSRGLGVMAVFLLVSQILSGCFDFGLYIPANTLLMAALCGAVVKLAAPCRPAIQDAEQSKTSKFSLVGSLLLVPLLAGGLEFQREGRVQRSFSVMDLNDLDEQRSSEILDQNIGLVSQALRYRWDDGEAHLALAQFCLQRYRVQLFEEYRRSQSWLDEERLWMQSSFAYQFQVLSEMQPVVRRDYQEIAKSNPLLTKAGKHLRLARSACPWLMPPHLWTALLGQLRGSQTSDVQVAVERAQRFGGGQEHTWYWSGVLLQFSGDTSGAISAWQRCIFRSRRYDVWINRWLRGLPTARLWDDLLANDPVLAIRWSEVLAPEETVPFFEHIADRGLPKEQMTEQQRTAWSRIFSNLGRKSLLEH